MQGLGRSFSELVALGVVGCRQPGHCSASQSAALGLGHMAGQSAALGLSLTARRYAILGLCVGQLMSAPSVQPPKVSIVGVPPGSQVWAPSPLI